MGWRHPIAAGIDDQTGQQTRRLRAHRQCTLLPMNRKLVLDDLPKLRIEDGLVPAGVGYTLVNDVAAIGPVLQHQIECPAGEMLTAGQPSAGAFTALAHDTQPVEFGPEQRDRAQFGIAPEHHPDGRRLRLIRDQFAVLDVVAERHVAAHPHALLLRRRDLVADALAGDLALELGEGEEHVERQTPHGGRRVELLRHRHKGRIVGIEDVDNLGEIGERPGQFESRGVRFSGA